MKIKETSNIQKVFSELTKFPKRIKILIFLFYSFFIILSSAYLTHKTNFITKVIKPVLNGDYRFLNKNTTPLFVPAEKIFIDIKFKDYQKLAYLREDALKKGRIITTDDSYIPAKIRIDDKVVKVSIRLKGDIIDHVEGDKWSLRIRTKGDNSIYGMKRFSLQDPKVAGYMNEWLLYKLYKNEGLIALRYNFVNVVINGKEMGLYALEESFSKELIENNRRNEGPILKFDESHLWDGSRSNSGTVKSQADIFFSSNIDVFRSEKTMADSTLLLDYLIGKQLLDNFRTGTIKASQAFDIEQVAKLYAIANLARSSHALRWKNVRIYYNPIQSKLELIGYNAYTNEAVGPIYSILWENNYANRFIVSEYHNLFFQDEAFVNAYLKALEKISDKEYLDQFFNSIEDELKSNLSIIRKYFPNYRFNKNVYYVNQKFIHGMLNPSIPISVKIKVNSELKYNNLDIFIANTGFLPIQVTSITTSDNRVQLFTKMKTFSGKKPSQPLKYQKLKLNNNKRFISKDDIKKGLIVNYHIVGFERCISAVTDMSNLDYYENIRILPPNKDLDEMVMIGDLLKIDNSHHTVTVKSKILEVKQDIIIPSGYKFICGKNTKINLLKSSKIFSYSPIKFTGTKDNPIIITSSDSTGQGIFILNCEEKSELNFVHFQNLNNPSKNGWELTGAVTFYEADVSINNCKFSHNLKGDDYLNIIRSEFNINNSLFENINADAFDSDFCEGSITNCTFIKCGNDAIDVSGTMINVDNVFIDGVGDKGLSSGENSKMIVNHLSIINSEIAICSKDMSVIEGFDVNLQKNKVGFVAFQKKFEFGPGSIEISQLEMEEITVPYLIESLSRLTIDEEKIESNNESVKDLLYGVKYGKASK